MLKAPTSWNPRFGSPLQISHPAPVQNRSGQFRRLCFISVPLSVCGLFLSRRIKLPKAQYRLRHRRIQRKACIWDTERANGGWLKRYQVRSQLVSGHEHHTHDQFFLKFVDVLLQSINSSGCSGMIANSQSIIRKQQRQRMRLLSRKLGRVLFLVCLKLICVEFPRLI